MPRSPASGIPAKGASKHRPDCGCQRCLGFEVANTAGQRHGAYALVSISEEADALAEILTPLVPAYRESDSVMVSLLALTLRRVSRAEPSIAAAEEARDRDGVERLERSQRQWVNTSVRILDLLGMDPTARSRLGLDLANTRRALSVVDLHAQAAEEALEAEVVEDVSDEEPAA